MGEFETVVIDDTLTRLYVSGDAQAGSAGSSSSIPWWGLNDEDAERLMRAADEAAIDAIARAAIDLLAERLGPTAKFATVGFSFGAHWAMWSPAERDRVAASVVYYGTTGGPFVSQAQAPVLGHFAETDPYEDDEGVAAFEEAVRSAGRDIVIHRYPGTGHWFAEPSRDAYRPEAADLAFERTVEFLERQLATRGD